MTVSEFAIGGNPDLSRVREPAMTLPERSGEVFC